VAHPQIYVQQLLNEIKKLEQEVINVPVERPQFECFPFNFARKGQNDAIRQILDHDFTVLTLPTGYGKTVCFLTAIGEWIRKGGKAIIFTRTNSLQEQIVKYDKYYNFTLLPLFAREKECPRIVDGLPACYERIKVGSGFIFWYNGKRYSYPCVDCPYERKLMEIETYFAFPRSRKIIVPIFNAGHFFLVRKLLKWSEKTFVVIDEADSTLDMLMEPVEVPKDAVENTDDPQEVLENALDYFNERIREVREEIKGIVDEIKRRADRGYIPHYLTGALREARLRKEFFEGQVLRLTFFRGCSGTLISYVKEDHVCLEVVDYNPIYIVKSLFGNVAKICLVSATPTIRNSSNDEIKIIEAEDIPFKNKIFVCPIANMSYTRVKEEDFYTLAKVMVAIISFVISKGYNSKFVLHAGNNRFHTLKFKQAIENVCGERGIKLNILIKDDDKSQLSLIRDFKNAKTPTLLIGAGFEYGEDFTDVTAQFVGKVPYPNLKDPKTEKLREVFGEDKFRIWYVCEAIRKIVQASGRNSRSPESLSFTVIFDESIIWLLRRYKFLFSRWFLQRLVVLGRGDKGVSTSHGGRCKKN
jgi:hypothetical protein